MDTHPMLDVSQWEEANPNPQLFIADGSSVTVGIRGGDLVITDGPEGHKRTRYIHRVPRIVRHLLILSGHGYISLDAQRWLDDCDITWCVIDRSDSSPRTIATSGRYVDPTLMRKQALCSQGGPLETVGVDIIRRFITSKLAGQAWNAENMLNNSAVASFIRERLSDVEAETSLARIGGWEGQAAESYWSAWKGLQIAWRKPAPVKPHWLTYPVRHTLKGAAEKNRNATDPVNALLNYGYKVAETECTLACYGVALSPAMGIAHVDRKARDSFALDLIEGIRPVVDEIVLDIISHPLDKRMFREDSQGVVHVCAPLTHTVASRIRAVAYKIVPDVTYVLKTLR